MKVLVTHVPAGSGHERAAQALTRALELSSHSTEATLLNALDGVDPFYRWCFTDGYLHLVHQAPLLWGALYHLTDYPAFHRPVQLLHRWNNHQHGTGLERIFLEADPDVILGTHFFPMEVAAFLKRSKRLRARLVTVITDYIPHSLWIAPGVDAYIVASVPGKEYLLRRGIRKDRIQVLGIPIDPKFSHRGNRSELLKKLELEPERLTILVGSGGAGTGPVRRLVLLLNSLQEAVQLIVVAGKNAVLVRTLEKLRSAVKHPMKVYGYVDHMDELMEVSDVLITKPGGLTCSEALTKGLPLVLVCPIPGQESRNAAVIAGQGAALRINRLSDLVEQVSKLCKDPHELKAMSHRAREAAFPEAAHHIARLVIH